MNRKTRMALGVMLMAGLLGGALAVSRLRAADEEKERVVKESDVPPAAMAALKRLAGAAKITQVQEEIEHGHTFYEGQWQGADGTIDALVTASGDLVEIEEIVSSDKVPAAVRAAATKAAGGDAKLVFEKKTAVYYETHFKKNGRGRELVFCPTGDTFHEEGSGGKSGDHDDD
ncbi:MAG: hypothetical protein U1A27_00780 [Phycisphaerae bacterium]